MFGRSLKTLQRLRTVRTNARQFGAAQKIIYTETDEAPALATYALLPIIRRFTKTAGIDVELSDISVSGRILAQFSDRLTPDQQVADNLSELGKLCKTPDANIIKLPNISASIPQLNEAVKELQGKGYNIPDFVQDPKTDEERENHQRYAKVLGSAVNPVLREGNSDRRVAPPVKNYAQKNPHRMGNWKNTIRTHVSYMEDGDYYSTEQSYIMGPEGGTVDITFNPSSGEKKVLKSNLPLQEGEVIDAAVMRVQALRAFYEQQMEAALKDDIMLSLHLKATMMKVSDPIFFGHAVTVFFKDAFAKHADTLKSIGANPNNGLGAVLSKLKELPDSKRAEIEMDFEACLEKRPALAMVNSDKGITNLHVPSDVIIDASMPVVVRDSGCMWNAMGELEETKCLIPDRCYAGFYDAVFDDVRENGQFDVATMGNIPNVGLMAQKAEEYGSHDKTFEMTDSGSVVVTDKNGKVIFEHSVEKGDVWRMCQTKDPPIKDWVGLAVRRARATGTPAVFWLDKNRAHDRSIIEKVEKYLPDHDTSGLELHFMAPVEAVKFSMARVRKGQDTISCTGNVLRDYLTDLFPILELGTSAKMLSIVPMLNGGAMYETGAGGSAPKHVQQFEQEGHLRWDSLGEYLAMASSLEGYAEQTGDNKAKILGETLMAATGKLLDNRKSPSRKVNQIDNRGSAFYIAKYWAEAMAEHDASFKPLADGLASNEDKITQELIDCQGEPVDVGGYYKPDPVLANKAMRPSETFNKFIDE